MSGSAEGLLKHIGNAGAQRLFCPDELSHLLEKAAIERASFPYVLNRAYYQNSFTLTAAKGKEIQYGATLSVLGGIVAKNFQHSFSHTTIGGLYDRFIFGLCPTGFEFEYRPWEGDVVPDAPCAVPTAREFGQAKSDWKKENPALADRVAENAIRASVICAAWSGTDRLLACHLEPARAFAEYQARVRTVLEPNPGENLDARCAFAILSCLRNHTGYVRRREVFRAINAGRFGPNAF